MVSLVLTHSHLKVPPLASETPFTWGVGWSVGVALLRCSVAPFPSWRAGTPCKRAGRTSRSSTPSTPFLSARSREVGAEAAKGSVFGRLLCCFFLGKTKGQMELLFFSAKMPRVGWSYFCSCKQTGEPYKRGHPKNASRAKWETSAHESGSGLGFQLPVWTPGSVIVSHDKR